METSFFISSPLPSFYLAWCKEQSPRLVETKGAPDLESTVLVIVSEFGFQFFPVRFDQDGAIGEDNGRDALIAVVDLQDEFCRLRVVLNYHVHIGYLMGFEKPLCAHAIRAVFGRVHYDLDGLEVVEIGHR